MSRPFVHLHVHSQFSLFDGYCGIKEMAKQASKLGMKHLALTDHGTLAGLIKFYQACHNNKINPILGCEFYINPNGATDRSKETGSANNHLLILAKNQKGWSNLIKLSNHSNLDKNYYYKPRIDFEILDAHREGLIVTSGCMKSELSELLIRPDEQSFQFALELANKYRDAFGEDYYLELMLHAPACGQDPANFVEFTRKQRFIFDQTLKLSKATGIGGVVTNDVHFLTPSCFEGQQFKKAYSMGKMSRSKEEFERGETDYDVNCYFMKSPEEMYETFIGHGTEDDPNLEACLERTLEVAEKCNVDIPLYERAKVCLPGDVLEEDPRFEGFLQNNYTKLAHLTRDAQYLYFLSYLGLMEKGLLQDPRYRERIDYELAVIGKTEYAKYLQIVMDYCRHSREVLGKYVGDRGSAAGSLTLFAIGITTTDPIVEGLSFERFLTAEHGWVAEERDFV